jgi:hypothetical protein
MCKMKTPKIPEAKLPMIAAPDNAEALAQADQEAMLRRRRRGAAANVLTGPSGIPATPTMGGVAA